MIKQASRFHYHRLGVWVHVNDALIRFHGLVSVPKAMAEAMVSGEADIFVGGIYQGDSTLEDLHWLLSGHKNQSCYATPDDIERFLEK